MAAGHHHQAVLHRKFNLLTWGVSIAGRLGHGDAVLEDEPRPRVVEELSVRACTLQAPRGRTGRGIAMLSDACGATCE